LSSHPEDLHPLIQGSTTQRSKILEDSPQGSLDAFSSSLFPGLVRPCQKRIDNEMDFKFSEKPLEGLEVRCSGVAGTTKEIPGGISY